MVTKVGDTFRIKGPPNEHATYSAFLKSNGLLKRRRRNGFFSMYWRPVPFRVSPSKGHFYLSFVRQKQKQKKRKTMLLSAPTFHLVGSEYNRLHKFDVLKVSFLLYCIYRLTWVWHGAELV